MIAGPPGQTPDPVTGRSLHGLAPERQDANSIPRARNKPIVFVLTQSSRAGPQACAHVEVEKRRLEAHPSSLSRQIPPRRRGCLVLTSSSLTSGGKPAPAARTVDAPPADAHPRVRARRKVLKPYRDQEGVQGGAVPGHTRDGPRRKCSTPSIGPRDTTSLLPAHQDQPRCTGTASHSKREPPLLDPQNRLSRRPRNPNAARVRHRADRSRRPYAMCYSRQSTSFLYRRRFCHASGCPPSLFCASCSPKLCHAQRRVRLGIVQDAAANLFRRHRSTGRIPRGPLEVSLKWSLRLPTAPRG